MFKNYVKSFQIVEAVQFTNKNKDQVFNSLMGAGFPDFENNIPILKVTTVHGDTAIIRFGDWVVKDSKIGTYYPVKDTVFNKNCIKDDFNKAVIIAAVAHSGQTDKGGENYLCHPLHIADRLKSKNEKIVAVLHDVVEDSRFTIEDISNFGFSSIVVKALTAITKKPKECYSSYIERIAENRVATVVKIIDLEHNMDITRFKTTTTKDFLLLAKYQNAWAKLKTI